MDLKIKDVAELLSVSETTIRRWLNEGKIPAYKLNHQYRFSRNEIESWLMNKRLNQTPEELPRVRGEEEIFPGKKGPQQFSLYRAIHRGGVLTNVRGKNGEEVIRSTMQLLSPNLKMDPEVLSELLIDRERMMPTALNNGFAVPHARESLPHNPFDQVAIVFPKQPIDFGALDQNPVHTLFFLFATGDKIHLHLLAKLAHLANTKEACELLKGRPDKTQLLEFIKEWEGNINIGNHS